MNDTSTATVTRDLAAWIASVRYQHLPASAVDSAKRQILDTLAVGWAGSGAAGVAPVRELLRGRGGYGESLVWGFNDRLPAPAAARLNGMMAAALDFDSLHDAAVVHPGIVVIPAAFAVADRVGATGDRIVAAVAAGTELLARLGHAVTTRPGWFYSSALGVFAAAGAASNLLGLDGVQTCHAFGIALSLAGGTLQPVNERALTKRLQSAFAAEAGVEAALLAAHGITGPSQALEGSSGFFGVHAEGHLETIAEALGRHFLINDLTYKKYPSCLFTHAAIEAAMQLIREHPIASHRVSRVVVTAPVEVHRVAGMDFAPGDQPQVAAQFSLKYCVASVLVRGHLSVNDIEPGAVCDPAILPVAKLVEVHIDPSRRGRFGPVDVAIQTDNGEKYTASVAAPPGAPESPLSLGYLREKAIACFGYGLHPISTTAAEQLCTSISRIETISSLTHLLAECGFPQVTTDGWTEIRLRKKC